jgi:spore coat protein CotH
MGHIKEPIGINFVVDSKVLTAIDRKSISEIIAYYKKTGKKKNVSTSLIIPTIKRVKKVKELV